jgi:hypothetical protein
VRLALNKLGDDLEFYIVAHHYTTGFGQSTPDQSEILTVYFSTDLESRYIATTKTFYRSVIRNIQPGLFRRAPNGQVSNQLIVAVRFLFERL